MAWCKKDIGCEKLHPDIMEAFLSMKKTKKFILLKDKKARERALEKNLLQEDKIMSFDHIRKYHDAILFGANERNVILSNEYYISIRKHLVAASKKEGNIDEMDFQNVYIKPTYA